MFSNSDILNETGKLYKELWFIVLIELFLAQTSLPVRWTAAIFPGILTLPGTVGRGFYPYGFTSKWEKWHMDDRVLRENPQN